MRAKLLQERANIPQVFSSSGLCVQLLEMRSWRSITWIFFHPKPQQQSQKNNYLLKKKAIDFHLIHLYFIANEVQCLLLLNICVLLFWNAYLHIFLPRCSFFSYLQKSSMFAINHQNFPNIYLILFNILLSQFYMIKLMNILLHVFFLQALFVTATSSKPKQTTTNLQLSSQRK